MNEATLKVIGSKDEILKVIEFIKMMAKDKHGSSWENGKNGLWFKGEAK